MKITNKIAYIAIGVFCTITISSISIAALSDAGSQTDPIVTKSYVEKRIVELEKKIAEANKLQIEQQISTVQGQLELLLKNSGSASSEFTLLQAKGEDVITLGDNSQFILRAGTAVAIAGAGGGISDLTKGTDLGTNQDVIKNHLLLCPKNDGRGIKIMSDSWIMIKGTYQIQPSK